MTALLEPPNRRRIVFVLNPLAYRAMDFEDVREIDSRPDVAVVNAAAAIEDPVTDNIKRQGLLVAGNVLVQNPYWPDRYAEISKAADGFAVDKSMLFAQLCQLLGAQEVSVRQVEDQKTRKSVTVGGGAGGDILGVSAGVSDSGVEAFARKLHFSDTFVGGPPDIAAANHFVNEHGLGGDSMMTSLIEMRSNRTNDHRSRTLSVDLSAEMERNLKIAADVAIPTFFSVQIEVSRIVQTAAHYQVVYQVNFPAF
jgi:hypothetical protein